MARAILTVLAVLLVAAMASRHAAADNQWISTPCATSPLWEAPMFAGNDACEQDSGSGGSMGGYNGEKCQATSYELRTIRFAPNDPQVMVVAAVNQTQGCSFTLESPADTVKNLQSMNNITQQGDSWLPLRYVDGAAVMQFAFDGATRRCLAFYKPGPLTNNRSVYEFTGYYCEPREPSVKGKPFTDQEIHIYLLVARFKS